MNTYIVTDCNGDTHAVDAHRFLVMSDYLVEFRDENETTIAAFAGWRAIFQRPVLLQQGSAATPTEDNNNG